MILEYMATILIYVFSVTVFMACLSLSYGIIAIPFGLVFKIEWPTKQGIKAIFTSLVLFRISGLVLGILEQM